LVANRSRTAIAAISDAAAQAAGTGWERVAAAARPHDAELLSLAARMCQLPSPE
jgi:uroporphyrinogen-III synthase